MKKLLVIAAMFFSAGTSNSQEVHIPNAFTPDGDARNDYWKPVFDDTLRFNDYDLMIWTRSGELVFETKDPFQYWDGTWWGSNVSESTFVYRLVARIDNNDMREEGFIKVIR
jgi:gliding motility-associated-like protein